MTKKKYYTISKQNRYGIGEPLFRFENLDGAISMFKYLMEGKAIDIGSESVPDTREKPDKDGYVSHIYLNIDKGEAEYHLGSEIIDVYTQEEFNKIKKERNEWLETFKKENKK
jgi:hypothetical protein